MYVFIVTGLFLNSAGLYLRYDRKVTVARSAERQQHPRSPGLLRRIDFCTALKIPVCDRSPGSFAVDGEVVIDSKSPTAITYMAARD